MNTAVSRMLAGSALLLIARVATAQSDPFVYRTEPVKTRTNVVVQEPLEIEVATPDRQPVPVNVYVGKAAANNDVPTQPKSEQHFYYQAVEQRTDSRPGATQRTAVLYTKGSVGQAMGIYVSQVPPAMAAQLRLKPRTGLVVEGVIPGSAAEKAGIQQYDVIDRVGDQSVLNPQQIERTFSRHKEGDQVAVEVIREGKRRTVSLTVNASQKPNPDYQFYKLTPGSDDANKSFGFTPQDRQKFDQMSDRLRDEVQKQEQKIEEMTAKIRDEAEQAKRQIQQLKDQIRREAQQQKEQMLRDFKLKADKGVKDGKDSQDQQGQSDDDHGKSEKF